MSSNCSDLIDAIYDENIELDGSLIKKEVDELIKIININKSKEYYI